MQKEYIGDATQLECGTNAPGASQMDIVAPHTLDLLTITGACAVQVDAGATSSLNFIIT